MNSLFLDPYRTSWPGDYPPPEDLFAAAAEVRKEAYAPFSRFAVGAAILSEGRGEFFLGCNVENSSYGLSLCAERNAMTALLARGGGKPLAMAIAGERGLPCLPCGACRQFLAEFNPSMIIVLEEGAKIGFFSLALLFPAPFILRRENPS